MFFRRFYDDGLAQASYLIGCPQTGEAIVIDPNRQVGQYLDAAKKEGLQITRVTETHMHADFLSGTRELAAATGATVLLSGAGGPDWQYAFPPEDSVELLHDGDVITLGGIQLDVLHTPGHTPEHLSFVVTDMAKSPEPIGIVSGDFVFVGDVGRPDLLEKVAGAANTQAAAAGALYDSVQLLAPYSGHVQIWPGHGAGSACGKALGALPSSTLGYERHTNWAFQTSDKATFIASVLDGQPSPPTYFAEMKRLNRAGAPLLRTAPPPFMESEQLADALRSGTVIDTRSVAAFATGHIPGTINIPMNGAFAKWAGWLLPYDRDLYLIADEKASAVGAIPDLRGLTSIGLDRIAGIFRSDVVAGAATAGLHRTMHQEPMAHVDALQAAGTTIIDVREDSEWLAGHVEGAMHRPLGTIGQTLADLDRDTPVALHCQGGSRSAIAASVLESLGFTNVTNLAGGWGARNRP